MHAWMRHVLSCKEKKKIMHACMLPGTRTYSWLRVHGLSCMHVFRLECSTATFNYFIYLYMRISGMYRLLGSQGEEHACTLQSAWAARGTYIWCMIQGIYSCFRQCEGCSLLRTEYVSNPFSAYLTVFNSGPEVNCIFTGKCRFLLFESRGALGSQDRARETRPWLVSQAWIFGLQQFFLTQ